MSELGGESPVGKIHGEEESTSDFGGVEEFLRVGAEVVREIIELIVFWADGPDYSIHGAHELAGGRANLIYRGFWLVFFCRERLAKEGNVGEAGAEVVVNITSDAATLFLEVFSGGEFLELVLVLST